LLKIRENDLLILFVLALIANFLPLGITPLFDLDEGAFSEATREMLVSKNYITTYLNGELRFDKPILIYWLELLSVKIFGVHTFSFRLPSAIAGTLWVLFTYFFTKKYFDKKSAFYAALFMLSALQITIISKAAIADALLNLFIALSMFCFYGYYKERKKHYLYTTFLFIALGFLTKGPVAIMIPFVVSFIFLLYKKEFGFWLKSIFNPIGLLIFIVVGLPWYILEYQEQGSLFIDGFFFKHNLSRFGSSMENHSGKFYYYVIVLLIGLMPFSLMFFKSLTHVKKFIKDDLTLFLLIWFGFVFLFFSFSGTKLPHYIIYGYTPVFILVAIGFEKNFMRQTLLLVLIFFTMFLLFFPEIAVAIKSIVHDKFAVVLIENVYSGFGWFYHVSVLALLGIFIWLYKKELSIKHTAVVIAFTFTILVNYAILPAYGKLMQLPIKKAALFAKEQGYHVKMHTRQFPSFNVYYQGLTSKEKAKEGDVVFCKVTSLDRYKKYETLYKENGFTLIRIEK